jgi:hypothetical protein
MTSLAKRSATVTAEQKLQLGGIFLLEQLAAGDSPFPLLLEGDDQLLEPLLDWLYRKGYTEIVDNSHYAPTNKGRKALERFVERHENFLRTLDIYSAVDLEAGSFAFERIFEFDDERDWNDYLGEERFSDLRIAVAEFKKLDPVETVFMACTDDGTLDVDEAGWQAALVHGDFWDFVQEVLDNALRPSDLSHHDGEGTVSGDDILRQVIIDGAELNLELKKEEARREAEDGGSDDGHADGNDEVGQETIVTEYAAYSDPYYVSPVWLLPWLL